ncbi:VCBS repeat-containing protein [Actinoplanes sp. NPDC051861]|uniref:FG-GAP repeat domain-containing protein n=1 Tax=Actinoplanes sp. NPDC051861 TaxID=3155170 RepID=UPI00341CC180
MSTKSRLLSAVLTLAAGVTLAVAPAASATAAPATPSFPAAIDDYAKNVAQSTCDPTAKPGALALRDLFNDAYGDHDGWIGRECSAVGVSEHKEGRALDYMLNVNDTGQRAIADDINNWLLATDRHGNKHANMRRLGVMYIIWNRRIISAERINEGWRPYTESNPHTDHIHISLSWAGAYQQTSWWTGAARTNPDLNGDGFSDLWALNTSDIQLVYPNKADRTGTFWSSRERGNAGFRLADLGDVDGNGSADLYAVTNDHDQLWYPNKGGNAMEFWSARNNGPAPGFRLMTLGDLNADGFADIVAVYQSNELVLYMNKADGSGTFYSAKQIGIAPGFKLMDLGDFTGDGYADLYAVTTEGQQLSYVNRGAGGNDVDRFWSSRELGYANFRAAQLGNLDGDKYADLYGITGDGTNQQIVYMNRATKGNDTARFWSGTGIGAAPGIKIPAL